MNFRNFKELKKCAKGVCIVYVEENKEFQKTIVKILENFFDDVYQAFSVEEAFEIFKQAKPDIVLTSMSFRLKSGLEMITEMKILDQKTKFIVLSELNGDLDLLYQLDLGISEILVKPSSNKQLVNALLKTLKSFDNTLFEKCMNMIRDHSKNSDWFYALNLYKGILLKNKASILSIEDNEIKLKLKRSQLAAAKSAGYSFFMLDETAYIKAYILSTDKTHNTVTYVKPRFLKNIPDEISHKMIQTDRDFVVNLKKESQNYKLRSLGISTNMLEVFSKESVKVKLNGEVEITLGFNTKRINTIIDDFAFNKIFAKGRVVSLEPYKGGLKIKMEISLKKTDIKTLERYINEQEENILLELRRF